MHSFKQENAWSSHLPIAAKDKRRYPYQPSQILLVHYGY